MTTTIDLNDDLIAEARKLAQRTGRSLEAVIEDGLREVLARQARPAARDKVSLITDGAGGVRADVNLDCTSELLNLMDENHATG